MAGISNTKEKSSVSGTGGQGEPPDFANKTLLALRRTQPISDELVKEICLNIRLFANDPAHAIQFAAKSDTSTKPLEKETINAFINRTILVALAGRYGYTKETSATYFPTYLTQISDLHPTDTLRHLAMAILDQRIKDIQNKAQPDPPAQLIRSFEIILPRNMPLKKQVANDMVRSLIAKQSAEITAELITAELKELGVTASRSSSLESLADSLKIESALYRTLIVQEIQSHWVAKWYPDDTTRILVIYRYGLGRSKEETLSVLEQRISDILPSLRNSFNS